jgi:hypothetical protein
MRSLHATKQSAGSRLLHVVGVSSAAWIDPGHRVCQRMRSLHAMEALQPVVDCYMSWRSEHAATVNLVVVGGWSGERNGVWRTVEPAT